MRTLLAVLAAVALVLTGCQKQKEFSDDSSTNSADNSSMEQTQASTPSDTNSTTASTTTVTTTTEQPAPDTSVVASGPASSETASTL